MVDIARARLERSVDTNTGVVDSGAAQVYGTLSQRLNEFSNRQMQEYAEQRVAQGSKEGAQASAGKVSGKLPEGNTLYERAFIETAVKGHMAAIKNSIDEKNAELQMKYPLDSKGYADEFNGVRNGLLKGIDPMLQPAAIAELDDAFSRGRVNILANEQKQMLAESAAETGTAFDSYSRDIEKYARSGDPVKASELEQKAFALISDPLLYTPEQQASMKDSLRDSVDTHLILGEFDRARGKKSFLNNFRKNKKGTQELTLAQIDKIDAYMEAEIRKIEADNNASLQSVRQRANDVLTMMSRGETSLAEQKHLTAQLASADPNFYQDFYNKAQIIEHVQLYAGRPAADIMVAANSITPTTIEESDRKQALLKLAVNANEGQSNANVVAYAEMNYPERFNIPPTDFSEESLKQRLVATDEVAAYYNKPNLSPLKPNEIVSLTSQWAYMDDASRTVMVENLVSGLGEKSIPVLNEVAGKGFKTFANVGAAAQRGDWDVVQHMMNGAKVPPEMLSTDATKASKSYFANKAYEMFSSNPNYGEMVVEGAQNIYKSLYVQSGNGPEDSFSEPLAQQALSMTVGGVDTVFGHPVPMPTRSTTGNDMERWLETTPLPEIPGYSEEKIREFIADGDIVPVEDGKGEYTFQWSRMTSYGPVSGRVVEIVGKDQKPVRMKYDFVPPTPTEWMNEQKLLDPIPFEMP